MGLFTFDHNTKKKGQKAVKAKRGGAFSSIFRKSLSADDDIPLQTLSSEEARSFDMNTMSSLPPSPHTPNFQLTFLMMMDNNNNNDEDDNVLLIKKSDSGSTSKAGTRMKRRVFMGFKNGWNKLQSALHKRRVLWNYKKQHSTMDEEITSEESSDSEVLDFLNDSGTSSLFKRDSF